MVSCAYYNTFFNAKKSFKAARKESEKRTDEKPTSQEVRLYDQAIEKASAVLELYPDSKYIDDAIMMLGQCFYYQANYVKAQRKFQELLQYFPESEFATTARIWLSRTSIELEDYPAAHLSLTSLLESPDLKKKERDQVQLLLGEMEFRQKDFIAAEKEFTSLASIASEEEIRAQSYHKAGLCELELQQYQSAIDNFGMAIKESPNQVFLFDSKLNHAKALKLAGQFDAAKRVCGQLLANESYKQKHEWVMLELADCVYLEGKKEYQASDDPNLKIDKLEEALEEFRIVTLENKRKEGSAHAFFKMAEIYEKDLSEFANAQEHYQKVKAEFARCELVPEATRKDKNLGDLIKLSNLVKRAQGEQLLEEGSSRVNLTPLELLLLEYGNVAEVRYMQARRARGLDDSTAVSDEDAEERELNELVRNKLRLAEIYLFQFGQVDSAIFEYNEVITLFPEHPDVVKALYSKAFVYDNEYDNSTTADSLLRAVVERFPDSPQAAEARKKLGLGNRASQADLAKVLFSQAESKLFEEDSVDSAVDDYMRVVREYPETDYAPKALLALGWIQEEVYKNNQKALQLYRNVTEGYPESEYSELVTKRLQTYERAVESEKKARELAEKEEAAIATGPVEATPDSLQATVVDSLQSGPAEEPGAPLTEEERVRRTEEMEEKYKRIMEEEMRKKEEEMRQQRQNSR
jgi:TolA-binding protein